MARKPTTKNHIRGLLDELEPDLRAAFMASLDEIKSKVSLKSIIDRLEANDIEGAVRAANISPVAYRQVQKTVESIFESGGEEAAKKVPRVTANNGSTALFRFDIRHPTAEQELRQYSSNLITRISEDQRQAVRESLANGIAQGRAPRRTALDIVGRINRVTGRREGGIVGLTTPQARYVESMRLRLSSGDPKVLEKIFGMSRRDKRFDRTIMKAIETGGKIPAEMIERMAARYADSLLLLRGETIARTETMTAFNKGQMASMQQAINEGKVSSDIVVKVWHAFLDERTRFTHRQLNGSTVGFYDRFITARGAQLMHPGDPEGGSGEVVCCRCWMETKIDFLADLD
ncbi:phage minor head protein [Shinella sp.]|uniref:phage minor head protein n=1 Tax=Shinella sp. TaxID=1870904 RepID=UPI0029BB00C7|nr:phage minor head protein [Shinella sp.]MDX3973292.1 phage minor head protein [Shinella sp.]